MPELTFNDLPILIQYVDENIENCVENVYNVRIDWYTYPNSVILNVPNKNPQIVKVGNFITYEGQETGVLILEFIGYEHKSGPNGFIYSPWRDYPNREYRKWGDDRFVICPPNGLPHYGVHINWFTVEVINHLVPTCNVEFQKN